MDKQSLRIVFLGTPEFAVESLEAIIAEGYNLVGVVTMPDKPAGRGHKMYQSPVKLCALSHGIPVLQPVKLKDPEFIGQLRDLRADLFIVIAFRMLPEVVWTMPPLGTFNLHASLLPRYRGAAPINRAVMNGDTETGVTTFFLRHDIDTGDIIDRERVDILPTDNVGDVHDRLMHLGATLTLKTIRDIVDGTVRTTPQSELVGDIEPTPAPKIFREDCEIDWTLPAVRIHNQVRGLSPYPGAFTTLADGSALKIFETTLCDSATAPALSPGETAVEGDTLYIGTGSAPLRVISLQPQGKRRMAAADWLRGLRAPVSLIVPSQSADNQ